MRKSLSILAALGIAFFAFSGTARADENDNKFSLHLEPGVVFPLTSPQSNLYNPGLALGTKGLFALTPNLSIGPSVSALYLPRQVDDGKNAGTLWQFGGSARLQTDRRNTVTDKVWSRLNPWIDVDATMAATGNLLRPAFDLGVGIETPLDSNHIAWAGPFVRYTHMFQTADDQSGIQLNKNDVNFLQIGLSVSFDTPTHPKKVTHVRTVERTVERKVVVIKHDAPAPCPPPVVQAAPVKVEFTEKVYFDYDQSVLRWESKDRLDAVVKKLNEHPDLKVRVQGHASSDGAVAHNVKLALARTTSVVSYLVAHGISADRLVPEGFGIDRPAAPNSSSEGRERNRRVEFEVSFTSVGK